MNSAPLAMNSAPLAIIKLNERFFFDRAPSALHASESDQLFMLIWWVSVFSFVVLMALMIYFALKYRRKERQVAEPSASHNTPLEIAWTIIPLGIMAVIFFKGFHGYMAHTVAPAGTIDVDLQAKKWDWLVTYPDGAQSPEKRLVGDKQAPIFVFPSGTPVRMRMHSIDVIHSFWVPDFRGKFDVMPNRYTVYWFQAEAPRMKLGDQDNPMAGTGKLKDGTTYDYEDHWVFCAEYCGDSHSEMTGIVRIVPPEIYPRIIELWGTAGLTPVQLGARVHATKCSSCHTIDGKPSTGPTWLDLYGKTEQFTDGTSAVVDDNYIRESILEPQKKIVQSFGPQMASFQGQIKEEQIAGVIAFMKSISKYAPKAAAGPDGAPAADAATEGKKAEPGAPGDKKEPQAPPAVKGSGK